MQNTSYRAHFLQTDSDGNDTVTASPVANFTTDAQSDITAPILSGATGVTYNFEQGTLSVSTDEGNGSLYWVVSQDTGPPTSDLIIAGQLDSGNASDANGSQAVTDTGTQFASAVPLAASTTYYAHFAQQDSATPVKNTSNVVFSSGFTTSATPSSIITNGDFATDLTGWTAGTAVTWDAGTAKLDGVTAGATTAHISEHHISTAMDRSRIISPVKRAGLS
jgi:hypothetical protein